MVFPVRSTPWTPAEYLAMERAAGARSELIDGQVVAMAGASRAHSLIAINLGREISGALRGQPCETYDGDMRVKLEGTGYVYPDLAIACGEPRFEDDHLDTLVDPTVIFEILSPSTEAFDRGEKFARYRRIGSLREYVLVSQDRARVERYARAGELWVLTVVEGLDGELALESADCRVPLRAVYERVEVSGEA